MIHQHMAGRFRRAHLRNRTIMVGTIPCGTIVYIQDWKAADVVRRNPWIIEAWLPREVGACRKVNGKWRPGYVANGSYLAQVRSLRDGRVRVVGEHYLLHAADQGLVKAA